MTKQISGLTKEDVERSRALHGDNSLEKEKRRSFLRRFIDNLSDPIIRILMGAMLLQIVFTLGRVNYFEVGGVFAAILLSTVVSTLSEYRSEQAFDRLREDSLEGSVSVIRDGVICKISASALVVGDVVYLNAGEKIHADGEILSGRISVDQSALNGESAECVKTAGKDDGWDLSSSCKVFRGSMILQGNAIMRVGRVGGATYYGMVAKDVQTETRESPLKLRLGRLARQISIIGYVVAVVVGVAYLFNAIVISSGFDPERIILSISNIPELLRTVLDALTMMITVVVVAAPEGLPMMITVVLSANMKRMLNDNILVKKLVGIETAGSLNILFTDKTGTLTVGVPQCERIITVGGEYRGKRELRSSGKLYDLLAISARYNTDVTYTAGVIAGGNATDRAIYEMFSDAEVPTYSIATREPFSSERKYSSVTLKNGISLIKGAAEMILTLSRQAINENGERVPFDSRRMYERYYTYAKCGERVVGVAIKQGDGELCFLALISMKDRVRPDAREAVRQITKAGIQAVMVTGDGRETAIAIAEECGLFNRAAGHIALSGEEVRNMTDYEVKAVLSRLRVVFRSLPQDKSRLVRLSQEENMVVGMTGDGINDAPSLKLSDVGFAMGGGADIAKGASDIIILDNSITSIARTVLYGRTIFKSIRKFITFQLTMNLAACGVSIIGQLLGVDTPITITQMLWVNIIMDTLGGLAFAGEPPLSYYMQERPISRSEQILSRDMLNQIFLTGAYTLGLSIFFLASRTVRELYGGIEPTAELYTAFYALFIFLGINNCLLSRSPRLNILSNIGKNKPFLLIMLLISVIQVMMIYFGGALFRCVPLKLHELSFVILLSLSVIPFEMMRRLVYKLK